MTDSEAIDKIYAALMLKGTDPDYDFSQLRGVWGYKNSESYHDHALRMTKNVRRLAKEVPVLCDEGSFYIFDGKIYVLVREELVVSAFDLFVEYFEITAAIGSKQYSKLFMDTIRYYNPLRPSRHYIAFSNGVLDTSPILHNRAPLFYPGHHEMYHVTYYHPYEYNPKASCRMWHNFLHEVLPDKTQRLILQMFLGLGLIDNAQIYNPYEGKDASKVELCLILIGSGANGKSVIYQTARGIYGKDRISGVDYDELVSPGDEGMRARRLLRNALFNWSSDSDSRTFGRKRTGVFKRIVSGEPVTDREIGGNVKENDNMPYLIFNLNELPFPDDQSLGFIRRLQFVSFDVTIPKERQNKSLAKDLIGNYPGIFNWVVRGAQELVRRKFIFPSSEGNRRQVLLSQLSVNPVLSWINAYQMRPDMRARQETGLFIGTDVMYQSLERFCEDNGVETPSRQKFGHTMARFGNGFYKKRFGDGVRYQVYGCTPERLAQSFVIRQEDMNLDYADERGTFISDDD